MLADETDVRLHERLLDGDDDALAEIYDHWAALVFSTAMRILGDRGGAEDVTQDVFVHLWEKPHAYNPDRGALRTWLCVVARGRAVDWVRRHQAQNRYQAKAAAESMVTQFQAGVDDDVLWQAEAKAVRDAVQALPPPQREAVTLAYYHQRTYREVARDLDIPEGTAKSRLRRGLAILADHLADAGIIDP